MNPSRSPQRLCPTCKIHWDRDKGLDCPKCKAWSFFTMNADDIGTAMYFRHSNDDVSLYVPYGEEAV